VFCSVIFTRLDVVAVQGIHILHQETRPSHYEIALSKLAEFETSVISEI